MKKLFSGKITKDQSRDTGMALVLVLLLVTAFTRKYGLLPWTIAALVINMTAPQLYKPLAVVWLGFSHLLGSVMSRIILGIIFFCVVTPIALIRKLAGKDSLKLSVFKAGSESAMVIRNHTFTAKDIEKPY
jgi:hypothetical protein